MIRLSIIVPFYNVEKYIEQCIRSLYDQDIPLEEYEVICVDDCSPDGSRAIVERLQKEYPNLQLIIHERNKKLGGARNTGLKAAKGEYIWFVDSDDYVMPNVYGTLLKEAESGKVDVLHFDNGTFTSDGHMSKNLYAYEDVTVYDGETFLSQKNTEVWYSRCAVAWRCLYQREFLLKNNLYFEEYVMYEDTDWALRVFIKAEHVLHANMLGYMYRLNEDSVTHVKRTPGLMRFAILQMNRCARIYPLARTEKYKRIISEMLYNQLPIIRLRLRNELSIMDKYSYNNLVRKDDLSSLKSYSNWRTWFAIKYGITIFVK